MSPSTILYYLGFDTEIADLLHHTFFFSSDLEEHFKLVFQELAESDPRRNQDDFERIISANDFSPLSDHRADAWYRLAVSENLVRDFLSIGASHE